MSDIVYDLTEVFSAATGRLRFYGILSVVREIGVELVRRDADVRFAMFSYAHQGFIEVQPIRSEDGGVSFDIPMGIRELRVRPPYRRKTLAARALVTVTNPLLGALNRRAWRKAGITRTVMDMDGKTLISAARPKLIADVMHAMDSRKSSVRLISLLHDMIPLHPQFGHKSAYFPGKFLDDNKIVISRSAELIANSEFTKSEIQAFAQKGILPPAPPITAIPLVHECPEGDGPPSLELPKSPYILTVGATMGRKNLEASLNALLHLHETGRDVPLLVIAGATRKTTEKHLETPRLAPIRDKVIGIPSPQQSDLVALYKGALALVMASRMEGWGLPAGEALWLGTPAICSTAPVLREVCGDLGLYFDPDRPEELADHLSRLMTDDAFLSDLKTRIAAQRPNLRTWSSVTDDLVALMQRL